MTRAGNGEGISSLDASVLSNENVALESMRTVEVRDGSANNTNLMASNQSIEETSNGIGLPQIHWSITKEMRYRAEEEIRIQN